MTAHPNHRPFTDGGYMSESMATGAARWYRRSRAVGASHVAVVPCAGAWWVIYHAAGPFTAWHDNPGRLALILSDTPETP